MKKLFKVGDVVIDRDLSEVIVRMRVTKVGTHVVAKQPDGLCIRYTPNELKYLQHAN